MLTIKTHIQNKLRIQTQKQSIHAIVDLTADEECVLADAENNLICVIDISASMTSAYATVISTVELNIFYCTQKYSTGHRIVW